MRSLLQVQSPRLAASPSKQGIAAFLFSGFLTGLDHVWAFLRAFTANLSLISGRGLFCLFQPLKEPRMPFLQNPVMHRPGASLPLPVSASPTAGLPPPHSIF